jgi:hypothetical protein
VLPGAVPCFHRDRRRPSSPWRCGDRSCDDVEKEPYPRHDRGTKIRSAGRDREGGREGNWHLAVHLYNRARSFPGLRGGLDDPQEGHPDPRGPLQNVDSLLQAGRIPSFRLLSRRQLALAQQRERHDPGDLAVGCLSVRSRRVERVAQALARTLRERARERSRRRGARSSCERACRRLAGCRASRETRALRVSDTRNRRFASIRARIRGRGYGRVCESRSDAARPITCAAPWTWAGELPIEWRGSTCIRQLRRAPVAARSPRLRDRGS